VIGGRSGVDHGVGSAAAAEAGVRVILQQLAGKLPTLGHALLAKITPLASPHLRGGKPIER